MSVRTARQNTRWDAPHIGARRAHPAIFDLPKQIAKDARNHPGDTKTVSPTGCTPGQGYGRKATTPASRQAGRRHGLHVFLRIL